MINKLLQIIGIVLISTITMGVLYFFTPLSLIDYIDGIIHPIKFGSTITTINGSDTISGSRTTINNNFANLNSGKLESSDAYSTTTLPQITTLNNLTTIGTIISGIWNGTAIGVAYGGTGTTSPTSNQIIIGNGASGFKVIGFGTSGQFLTSGGNATAPSWTTSSIDASQNYNFTGTNLFKNLNASSTVANPLVLNGVSLNTPSSQGGVGTFLQNDGSGNLTWAKPLQYNLISQSGISVNNTTATSSLLGIPANVLTASSTITIDGEGTCTGGTGGNGIKITNANGSPFATFYPPTSNCATTNVVFPFHVVIYMNGSTASQLTNIYGAVVQTSGTISSANQADLTGSTGTSVFNLSNAFSIGFNLNWNGTLSISRYSIVVNP